MSYNYMDFKNFLKEVNWNFDEFKSDNKVKYTLKFKLKDGKTITLIVVFQKDTTSWKKGFPSVNIIFRDFINIGRIPEEKELEFYKCLDELNMKYLVTSLKFTVDKKNKDLLLGIPIMICNKTIIHSSIRYGADVIDEEYSKIMKEIWS